MSNIIEVTKSGDDELPVPTLWRKTFENIIKSMTEGNSTLEGIPSVDPISKEDAAYNMRNVDSYGDELDALPSDTWKTSICKWSGDHWDVLVDLYTVRDGASDLVLSLKVYESGNGYLFKVGSIYTP